MNQQKTATALEKQSRGRKGIEMDTLRDDGDEFNEQFYGEGERIGFGRGWHELGPDEPTASDPHPGRFRCDDEPSEDFMNLQVRQEVDRLRREVPDLIQFDITPGLHWSGNADRLTVDALPWKVLFFAGADLFIGDGATLADAIADGLVKYRATRRARVMDAVGTEGVAA